MHRSVLENADFTAWANENVVMVVGHEGSKHKSSAKSDKDAKDGKDGGKGGGSDEKDGGVKDGADSSSGDKPAGGGATPCSLYPGLTCEEHEKTVEDAKTGPPELSF